jgi:carbon storage regulator
MLCLSRRENESLWIGETIEVQVVRIDKDKVRLAISAPREVSVRRSELRPYEAKR